MRLPFQKRQSIHTATEGRDVLMNYPDGWIQDAPNLWWVPPPPGTPQTTVWGNPPPGASEARRFSTLPAVTRCTSIICDTIAGLPWDVYRGYDRLDVPDWVKDPMATRNDGRIVSPGLRQQEVRLSEVEFWSQWILAALWLGDGYLYIPVRDAAGAPKPPLWQFHPSEVTVDEGRYVVAGEPMAPGEIIHLRGFGPYHDGLGRGVMVNHAQDLGLAITVRNYSGQQYRSGIPAGYLKSSQPHLEEQDALELKDKWLAQHEGRRSIAVLNATTEFQPIQVTPLDSALDVQNTWDLRQICLAFGVPADLLDVPGPSNTYANTESRMIELRMLTLQPWCRRVESTLDAQLPRGTSLKVRMSGLERADTKTRYESYKIGIDTGFLTIDDVRALEDLPPLSEDEPYGVPTPPPPAPPAPAVPPALPPQPTGVPA